MMVTLIGFATVFIVLAIMWSVLEIMHKIFAQRNLGGNTKSPITKMSCAPNDEFAEVLKAAISASTGKDANSFNIVSYAKTEE